MPTKKPRVAVTLSEQTHDVIARMAALQGVSRGAVIADLLDSIAPALTRTVAILEAARDAPEHVKRGLLQVAESVHEEVVGAAGQATGALDDLLREASKRE